jgi:hypothetical protein
MAFRCFICVALFLLKEEPLEKPLLEEAVFEILLDFFLVIEELVEIAFLEGDLLDPNEDLDELLDLEGDLPKEDLLDLKEEEDRNDEKDLNELFDLENPLA